MKEILRKVLPNGIWNILRFINQQRLLKKYRRNGRPFVAAESTKAKARRMRENFYELYCSGKGLDIGYGGDKIVFDCDVWDFEHGDAQYVNGLQEEMYDFVYSSHTLEHICNPGVALRNWFRLVKEDGFLIVYIPHRDFYEKKKTLPSRWNSDHKYFFLPDGDELPDTLGVKQLVERSLTNYSIVYLKECSEGNTIKDEQVHSDGEYSIEVVIKKDK